MKINYFSLILRYFIVVFHLYFSVFQLYKYLDFLHYIIFMPLKIIHKLVLMLQFSFPFEYFVTFFISENISHYSHLSHLSSEYLLLLFHG